MRLSYKNDVQPEIDNINKATNGIHNISITNKNGLWIVLSNNIELHKGTLRECYSFILGMKSIKER